MKNLEIAPQETPTANNISEERKRLRQQEQERRRKEAVRIDHKIFLNSF